MRLKRYGLAYSKSRTRRQGSDLMFFNKLMQILSYDEETDLDDAAVAIEQHRKRLQDECIEYVRSIRDIEGLTELRKSLQEYFMDGGD